MSERILIVDDDRDSLKLIGLMLQRRGYAITVGQSGSQALAKAAADRPDLIILDVMMPDMDGYEVCRQLRANPETAHIPIIMFTAKSQITDKVAGFQAGADDYLTKPIHPVELATRVETVLLRTARNRAQATQPVSSRMIGFIGSKGGVGTTTLALNVAAALAQTGSDQARRVILAEMVPGAGSAGLQLGYAHPLGLATLMCKAAEELDARLVESQLTSHSSGMRLLLAPIEPRGEPLPVRQAEAVMEELARMSDLVVMDLGSCLDEATSALARRCDFIVLVTDPHRVAVALAESMLAGLAAQDVLRAKIGLVLLSRTPSAEGEPAAESALGEALAALATLATLAVIPPAPELAFQAAEAGTPVVLLEPDSSIAGQIRNLARLITAQ